MNNERKQKFIMLQYDWIRKGLTQDYLLEELALFELATVSGLRKMEYEMLTIEQYDSINAKLLDVKIYFEGF